jgi:hypothetical protein
MNNKWEMKESSGESLLVFHSIPHDLVAKTFDFFSQRRSPARSHDFRTTQDSSVVSLV